MLREAERMHERSLECPELAAMIVPSPYGLAGETFFRSLIDSGFLGTLREIHVHSFNDQLADPAAEMGWRQMTRYSGFNMLTLGIVYETMLRWVAPANRVWLVPRRSWRIDSTASWARRYESERRIACKL